MQANTIAIAAIMQLATTSGDRPWVCNVYFVLVDGTFYWLSYPWRRHSKEIEQNPQAALTIALKSDTPVVGIQAEGAVRLVTDLAEVERVLPLYTKKYGQGGQFVALYKAGKNQHNLYACTPRRTVRFDELHYPDDPYQEITIT